MNSKAWFLSKVTTISRLASALRFVWQSGPRLSLVNLSTVIVQGTLPLLGIYLMKLVIDAITAGIAASDKGAAFRHVLLLMGIGLLLIIAGILFNSIAGLVLEAQAQSVTDYMHDLLHAKAIEVDLEYYENSQYYDTLYRTKQEAPYRPARILSDLLQIGRNSISLLAFSGLLFSLHWSVPVILLAASFPSVIVGFKYSRKFYHWQCNSTLKERKGSYLSELLTEAPFAKEVRLFGLGGLFNRHFNVLRRQLYREKLLIFTRRAVEQLVSQTFSSLMVFSVLLIFRGAL
jgi:ATP-binding cassette, subfamily B, bacterial